MKDWLRRRAPGFEALRVPALCEQRCYPDIPVRCTANIPVVGIAPHRALSLPESRYAGDALCTGAAGSVEIALAQAAQCVNR